MRLTFSPPVLRVPPADPLGLEVQVQLEGLFFDAERGHVALFLGPGSRLEIAVPNLHAARLLATKLFDGERYVVTIPIRCEEP